MGSNTVAPYTMFSMQNNVIIRQAALQSAPESRVMVQAGCSVASSVSNALQHANVVVLMLSDASAIEATLPLDGDGALQGKTVVQMATIGPSESRELASKCEAAGAQYLEAPVLGSQPEARQGTLLIMVGAAADPAQSAAWPVLCALSEEPQHIGKVRRTATAAVLAVSACCAALCASFVGRTLCACDHSQSLHYEVAHIAHQWPCHICTAAAACSSAVAARNNFQTAARVKLLVVAEISSCDSRSTHSSVLHAGGRRCRCEAGKQSAHRQPDDWLCHVSCPP